METWVVITVVAAFLQNVRSAVQKHLKGRMGTTGATFVRFGFGAPFALLYFAVLAWAMHRPVPAPSLLFAAWAVLGGAAQILATALLVHLFSLRNFAVGTAYSRTEPVQAALFAFVAFGEQLGIGALAAIAISMAGVMLITLSQFSFDRQGLASALKSRSAAIGLLSGAGFGVAAVAYRKASLTLGLTLHSPDYVMQAATTLVAVILFQSAVMLAWIFWRERGELARIAAAWRWSLLTGFVGATASFGWFSAMTLQSASLVKAVAQVEMLFTYASALIIFRETVSLRETIGCALIVAGILVLLYQTG